MDRLEEIELGFLGHPDDDYYLVEAKDFKWLVEEVKRLRRICGIVAPDEVQVK